ncbi:hypothetical protein P0L94_03415 [Microbacter sp. GSS18]|nr:hypothetical protein P0L94_03415 [Microbacter sp. GSS18]
MRRIQAALGALVLALGLSACAQGATMPDPSATPGSTGRPQPAASAGAVPTGYPVALPAAYRDALEADLAARGIEGTLVIVSSEAVTWGDGSLGCPEPGMAYTQALEEGMRVIVEVNGVSYDYRFGSRPVPRLCES